MSEKSENNLELVKFKTGGSDTVVETGDVDRKKTGDLDEEKVSLTHTDKWTDGKDLPVVVIEDQSTLIISM